MYAGSGGELIVVAVVQGLSDLLALVRGGALGACNSRCMVLSAPHLRRGAPSNRYWCFWGGNSPFNLAYIPVSLLCVYSSRGLRPRTAL